MELELNFKSRKCEGQLCNLLYPVNSMEIETPHLHQMRRKITVLVYIFGHRNEVLFYLPLFDWFGNAGQPLTAHSLLSGMPQLLQQLPCEPDASSR